MKICDEEKNPAGTFLVYQQLFIYAFLLYGVWVNLILQKLMESWGASGVVKIRVMTAQPILGLPFLLISWYMLIRFFQTILRLRWNRWATLAYFIICVSVIPVMLFLTAKNSSTNGNLAAHYAVTTFPLLENSHFLVYRFIASANGVIHLLLLLPLVKKYNKIISKDCRESRLFMLAYFLTIVLYTILILLVVNLHFVYALLAIFMVFLSNLFLPLCTGGIAITRPAGIPAHPNPASSGQGRNLPPTNMTDPNSLFEAFCLRYDISRREAEIIMEIKAGKSNREIANSLFITVQTVKDHIHRIFTKTGVTNRVQLINLSGRRGPGTG